MKSVIKIAKSLFVVIVMLGVWGTSSAMPVNPQVIQGSANFDLNLNQLTITTTALDTIINWDHFFIDANEIVLFSQPSDSSTVLNRALDNVMTIHGTLQGNGNIGLEAGTITITCPSSCIGSGSIINPEPISVSPVPLPAAAWLFLSGMIGLFGVSYRRNS